MGVIRRLVSPANSFSHTTMDYLTILTTRSLVLFDTPVSPVSSAASTPLSSPSSTVAPMSPPPVSIPLLSLMKDEVHCAHFLSNHVLESSGASRDTHSVAFDSKHRAALQEAEVLAWQEICRAKTFAQELGRHYGRVDNVREEELVALAATHGLGLAPISRRERPRERTHDSVPRNLAARVAEPTVPAFLA